MSDRLDRRLPGASGSERYGTWDLAGDRTVAELSAEEPLDSGGVTEWDEAAEVRLRALIVRQRRLSITASAVLLGLVLAVVVASHVFPGTMATPVWRGFSPALLALGVLIYPLTWLVAALFVVLSNRMDGLP